MMKWYPSLNLLAQIGHFFFGLLIVLGPRALTDSFWGPLFGSFAGVLLFAAKEFTFDLWIEKDTIDEGWKDIIYFTCGVGLGWVLLLAFGRV